MDKTLENEIKWSLTDDELDEIRTIEIKNSYDNRLQEEMKRMALTSGHDIENYFHKLDKKQKKAKREKKREERRKKMSYFLYRITHLGKMHPDEFIQKYYTDERLMKMLNDYKNGNEQKIMNVGRRVYLENDKEGGKSYWRVGEEIFNNN